MSLDKISVFLPIYNEEDVIATVVSDSLSYLSNKFEKYELILINDGSTDNTLELLKELANTHKNVKVIDHVVNKGYGAAIISGIENASYDWIFFMDSDGQFALSSIEHFLPYVASADMVIGIREMRNDKVSRLLFSKTYKQLVNLLFGLSVTDTDCAFKLMNRHKVTDLNLKASSFFISTELLCKAQRRGYKIVELPVKHYPRTVGKSTVNVKRSIESIVELLKLFKTIRHT